jgi:hypothetical protein
MHSLGIIAITITEQLMSTAPLIRESLSVTGSVYYINKGILCPRNNNVHHITGDILNILDGYIKTFYRLNEGRCFPV